MAQTVCVILRADDRARLAADRGRSQPSAEARQRARIVLLSAERLRSGVARRRRQPACGVALAARFAEEGVDGLLRDKTRKPGKTPLPPATIAKVLALTCAEPPGEATHWTGRAMAKAVGVSLRAVQRIWEAHRLQPHRIRTFKTSNDPAFAEKVEDIVGLYMDPPAHALVLSIDEKCQIQALDRTQPGLPLKPGKGGTMTHDYKRHGTTTLFAALNVLDGTVVGRCMPRHRHQEFIRFLNAVEARSRPARSSTPLPTTTPPTSTPRSRTGSPTIQRWVFHFTPTSASWLNAVETFFSGSPADASGAASSPPSPTSRRHQPLHPRAQPDPEPFVWTKTADAILAKSAACLYLPNVSCSALGVGVRHSSAALPARHDRGVLAALPPYLEHYLQEYIEAARIAKAA